MKRIIFIFCLSIVSLTMSAQFGPGSEPGLLEYKHTTFVEGVSMQDLEKKANEWMESVGSLGNSPYILLEDGREQFHSVNRLHYVIAHKIRLSIDKFVPGGGEDTIVQFKGDVGCRDGLYTITVYRIRTVGMPFTGCYYGENGALYPEFYTKRQLKHSIPVLDFIKYRADENFCEIDDYMLN